MKVLFLDFVTSMGGVQTVLINTLKNMEKDISVAYLDPYSHTEFASKLKEENIPIIRMPIWPNIKVIGWKNNLRRVAALLFLGPSYLLYILRLIRVLKNYDCIYCSQKKSLIIGHMVNFFSRKKIIFHAHGFHNYNSISLIYKWCISNSDSIIAVSNDVRTKMLNYGVKENKINVIYNGVDLDAIEKSPAVIPDNLNLNMRNIFIGCSIQSIKGVHLLIEAINNLIKKNYPINLYIAGETPLGAAEDYFHKLLEYISHNNLGGTVRFLGWRSDILGIIKTMDIVVLPSLIDESFGLIIAEAMAIGKPVIASNVGGLKEIISDQNNGLLVYPGKVDELEHAIAQLLSDKNLSKRLAEEGRRTIREKFSLDKQVVKISKIIRDLGKFI